MVRISARRAARSALSSVEPLLPVPWGIDALVTRLAVHRGRSIHLIVWEFEPDDEGPTGVWMPSANADYIFFDATASPARREQIIGHELGHMLLGHVPRLQEAPDALLTILAPSLSPELSRRVLGLARRAYSDFDEAMAEEFGTALIRRGASKRPPGGPDELGRLTDALR